VNQSITPSEGAPPPGGPMAADRPGAAEVRGVIASRQGLSCETYYALSARTAHLRERLYVSVRDGEKVFLPHGYEHFPVSEIEAHYIGRIRAGYPDNIGAGGGEVVFSCEGPAADEGATIITATLAEFEPLLLLPSISRYLAAIPHKRDHYATLAGRVPSYRPERLPERSGVPEPLTEEERRHARELAVVLKETRARLKEEARENLKRWGLLEDYERYAAPAQPEGYTPRGPTRDISRTINQSPWEVTPWK
jgi:hypothetical protein